MDEKINRKGQITLWVIVAVVFVAILIIFFLFRGEITPKVDDNAGENPRSYIGACIRKSTTNAIDILLPQGGFIVPEHYINYNKQNITYLCYNAGNYNPCNNEHPMLINEIKAEIKNYIRPIIDNCYLDYKSEMEKRNAGVFVGDQMIINVKLGNERVYVDVDREVSMKKNDESYNLNEINSEIISPVYDLARVAMEIASQEAKYCYFEYGGYMILYPEFKISRKVISEGTVIYIITHKKSGKVMNIAIRGCNIPPGF